MERDEEARRPENPPPASAEEALARARHHGRNAVSEVLAALHALIDAASIAASGAPSESNRVLGPLAKLVEGLSEGLAESGTGAAPVLGAIAEALDVEIARWEERARDEPEARAVLRAFLGMREILWEFGVRRPEGGGNGGPDTSTRRPRGKGSGGGRRVQRVPVEG